MRSLTAGILGGMGPQAAIDFQQRIIRHTRALDDSDHIHCLVDNNPAIPSRISHIIDKTGEDPSPVIIDMAQRLEKWGADFIVIPCNTAHYYYDSIQKSVSIPVLNILDLVVDEVLSLKPPGSMVGILGSTAIIRTGLYDDRFREKGIQTVYPDSGVQNVLFDLIKAGKAFTKAGFCLI